MDTGERRPAMRRSFRDVGFRKLLRISWTQRKTNEWILEKLNEDRLLNSIKSRHGKSDSMDMSRGSLAVWRKTLYSQSVRGSRSRGRQRRRWTEVGVN